MNNWRVILTSLFFFVSHAALAVGPPCNPCAGVRVADPASIADQLGRDPRLEGEARLYVSWPAELDGSADPGGFDTVRGYGGTPFMVVHFRTPQPVREHLDQLEGELKELARLARAGRWEELERGSVMDCMEGGACTFACPSGVPVVHLIRAAKMAIRDHKAKPA